MTINFHNQWRTKDGFLWFGLVVGREAGYEGGGFCIGLAMLGFTVDVSFSRKV